MMHKQSFLIKVIRNFFGKVDYFPRSAQIEITNLCNLDCAMCFRNFIDVDLSQMDLEIFKAIVDKLDGVEMVTPTGYGEPLLHPHLYEMISYCKKKKFSVRITSNGLLLDSDEKIKKLIESGLDDISFSVESIHEAQDYDHPNQEALSNILRLVQLKKEIGILTPRITIQTLMLKNREQDVIDIIEWTAEHDVDRVNVARYEMNTLPDIERPSVDEEKKLFKQFSLLRKKYSIQIDCLQDQVFSGLKGFLYKYFKYILRMDTHCIRLQDFVHIGVNGDIRPCCALVDYKMGELPKDDLSVVWNSDKYNLFRKNYYKAFWCKGCDFAKLKQISKDKK